MTYAPNEWPAWNAWTTDERIRFSATVSLKSSYGGNPALRFTTAAECTGITREQWDAATASLIARRVFNRGGAVRPEWKRRYYSEPHKGRPCVSQSDPREWFDDLH